MRYKMIQERFVDAVRRGTKTQTIRPKPRRNVWLPRCGDFYSLRRWAGKPYRSVQEEVARVVIDSVGEICLGRKGYEIISDTMCNDHIVTAAEDLDVFAYLDGFEDWEQLVKWFLNVHKSLPFRGIIIQWTLVELDGIHSIEEEKYQTIINPTKACGK